MNNLSKILNQYFKNAPKEVLEKDWKELEIMNNFGSDITEYVDMVHAAFNINEFESTETFANFDDVYHTEEVEYYLAA